MLLPPPATPAGTLTLTLTQALKSLSPSSPFDESDPETLTLTLPSRLARRSAAPKPHHKSHRRKTVWDSTAAFFDPISIADIDELLTYIAFGTGKIDPCLTIPPLGDKLGLETDDLSNLSQLVSVPVVEEVEEIGNTWILGTRYRWLLTSERPTKKRKVLGGEAGLDQLLSLPYTTYAMKLCDVCYLGESEDDGDGIVECNVCKVLVHRRCYGVGKGVVGEWLCNSCRMGEGKAERRCALCKKVGGAMKPLGNAGMEFVHLFCSIWTPEMYVKNTRTMEPVVNNGGAYYERRTKLVCNLCQVEGVSIRCSNGSCRTSFHPLCAREAKNRMEIWGKLGCDNVELRAFCSKHSSPHGKHFGNLRVNVADISSVAKPPPLLPVNKLPKLSLSHSVRDDFESQLIKVMDTCGVTKCGNIGNGPNLVLFLRKLIDRGKANVDDVASEIGVSSKLLGVLLGQTSSFSLSSNSDLNSKLMRWLQKYAHSLRIKHGPVIPLANGAAPVEGSDASEVSDPFTDDSAAGLGSPDSVVVRSSPPEMHTVNKFRIVGDDRTSPSGGTVIQKLGNEKLVDENNGISAVLIEDTKKEHHDNVSSLQYQGVCDDALKFSERIVEGTGQLIDHNPSLELSMEQKDNSMELESVKLSEANEANTADISAPLIIEKDCRATHNCAANFWVYDGRRDIIVGESGSSYVHPMIKGRLMQVQGHAASGRNHEEACPVCTGEKVASSGEAVALASDSTDNNHGFHAMKIDQLSIAKSMGILELSPEDEVEEELLYLQSKLVDKSVAIKHSSEDLLAVVIKNLPQELGFLNKRRWDMVHAGQYLWAFREAKKRGKKERKHKEAHVLAAAVAAASPRNSSLRKDANDEIISLNQESRLKVSSAAGGAGLCSLLVPHSESSRIAVAKVSPDNALSCDICSRVGTLLIRIFVCSSCKVAVHIDCYRKNKDPIITWKCDLCEEISSLSRSQTNEVVGRERQLVDAHCSLCASAAPGAFRKSTDGQWVHAFCAEWLLESRYQRGQENPVEGMEMILKERSFHSCYLCHRNVGVCLKCSYGHCQKSFHPSCARGAGLYMNVKSGYGRLVHKAYCEKHSLEQREADCQRRGAEDLKTVKRLRVELEKLRLLCERIIKREKLKRDFVLCSQEVLNARKNDAIYKVLVRNSNFRHGSSSESATTSLHSEAIQISDDNTVDSTLSVEHTVVLSRNSDADRTDDSSTSPLSFKRKYAQISNRASFGGKKLPNRPSSVAMLNPEDDGDVICNARKHAGMLQKGTLMISNQTLMQNQLHLKGFAYVPVGSLSKEMPVTFDLESCEPGG